MGMIKDMVSGFETLSKIGRCASNGPLNIRLSTLEYGEDPDKAILPIFYPTCVIRRVDMANFLNYAKRPVNTVHNKQKFKEKAHCYKSIFLTLFYHIDTL